MTFPYLPTVPGGGSIGCQRIADQLANLGAATTVFAVGRGSPTRAFTLNMSVPLHIVQPSRAHYLLDANALAKAIAQQPKGSLDWIIGWSTEAAWLPHVASRLGARFSMILALPSYRSWFSRRTRLRPLKQVVDRVYRIQPVKSADLVFALSMFTRSEAIDLMGISPAKAVVTYWGVDPVFFGVTPAPEKRRILFYGSLAPHKGVFDSLAVCQRLARGGIQFEMRIAGWGDVAAVYRAAHRAGVAERVQFLGTLDRKGLCAELAKATVALLPSHSESFGLAIAEAQAAAVPVVSYRAGAVPEVVDDQVTGLLVPPGDIDGLAGAVAHLLSEPELVRRMGGAARCRMAERFTWEYTGKSMLAALSAYSGST